MLRNSVKVINVYEIIDFSESFNVKVSKQMFQHLKKVSGLLEGQHNKV